jgi:hypothetical protein
MIDLDDNRRGGCNKPKKLICNTYMTLLIFDRTNERHDELLQLKNRNLIELRHARVRRAALAKKHKLEEKGILGPCILRQLSAFDVGKSFLADSLHNVYLGVFVSFLYSRLVQRELLYPPFSVDCCVYGSVKLIRARNGTCMVVSTK